VGLVDKEAEQKKIFLGIGIVLYADFAKIRWINHEYINSRSELI